MKKLKNHSQKKMSDIARLAGVSESTVSRALSGSTLISQKTRERIEKIAAEQHYVINKQAQNLRLQSSRTVSVIIPVVHEPRQHVSDPFFLELLGAIADALTDAGYDLLLSRVKADDWRKRVASHSYVDGLIVIGQSAIHSDINHFVDQSSLPLVVWGAHMPDQRYITVGSDNFMGGQLATQHLLSIGRRRLLFLGDTALPEVSLRHSGYLASLQQVGLEPDPKLTIQCGFSAESGHLALDKILQSDLAFDAVFAASDVLASIAMKRLSAAGRSVPGDVAIVGFDDISIAAHMAPALTTVSQNIYPGGRTLVDSLFALMKGESVANQILPPHLKVRDSA